VPVALMPGTLNLPLTGQPQAYPFDAFEFSPPTTFSVRLPRGIELPPRKVRGVAVPVEGLPVRLEIFTNPATDAFQWQLIAESFLSERALFAVRAERQGSTKFFIGAVLLVPLLFVFLLALALRRRAATEGAPDLRDLLLGLIGATLALLPLRQVLVPAEFETLTLIDWYLGGVVLLCAAIALWWTPRALR